MIDNLKKQLIRHEGLRLYPYRCTAGKLTIGVGRNLDDNGISKDEAMAMLDRDDNQFMFTTIRKNLKLQPFVVRRIVKTVAGRISKKDGIKVHPHLFRHSLASNMLGRGAGLLTIKEQLGHADIHTTMGYITARENHIRSEYHMYVPSHL